MKPAEFRAILAELGLSHAELARRLGDAAGRAVSPSTIWRYTLAAKNPNAAAVPPGLAAYLRLLKSLRDLGVRI